MYIPQHFLEIGVQPDVAKRSLIVNGQLLDGALGELGRAAAGHLRTLPQSGSARDLPR
jgi:hypothetical protein